MFCCGPSRRSNALRRLTAGLQANAAAGVTAQEVVALIAREQSTRCRPEKRPNPKDCCLPLGSDTPIDYPDPAIYSQEQQIALGNVPSWDNPDILTNYWAPFRLMTESRITVRNLSSTISAVNTLVHFSTSPFGIGMPQTLIASKQVSIAPASQVELLFPLPQATLKGDQRVGVYIRIEHSGGDANYDNNNGAQVHDGSYTTESGRNYAVAIPVYNDSNFSRQIQLSVMPTDIVASISPASHFFAPHEQLIATLNINVPAFLSGSPSNIISRAVTVVGRLTTGELIGGATKLLRIDN
jgi:hypothetical protein